MFPKYYSDGKNTGKCSSGGWVWKFITYCGMQLRHTQVQEHHKSGHSSSCTAWTCQAWSTAISGTSCFHIECGILILLSCSVRIGPSELEAAKDFCQAGAWNPSCISHMMWCIITHNIPTHVLFNHLIKHRFTNEENFWVSKRMPEPEKKCVCTPFPHNKQNRNTQETTESSSVLYLGTGLTQGT